MPLNSARLHLPPAICGRQTEGAVRDQQRDTARSRPSRVAPPRTSWRDNSAECQHPSDHRSALRPALTPEQQPYPGAMAAARRQGVELLRDPGPVSGFSTIVARPGAVLWRIHTSLLLRPRRAIFPDLSTAYPCRPLPHRPVGGVMRAGQFRLYRQEFITSAYGYIDEGSDVGEDIGRFTLPTNSASKFQYGAFQDDAAFVLPSITEVS